MLGCSYDITDKKVIIRIKKRTCETQEELIGSSLFKAILNRSIKHLKQKKSRLLAIFPETEITDQTTDTLIDVFKYLTKIPAALVPKIVDNSDSFFKDIHLFNDFVEYLYNYWRSYSRIIICDSIGDALDKRPYRTFNDSIEQIAHLIRASYRDIQENLSGTHPNIYRQVSAGAELACISVLKQIPFSSATYQKLNQIPVVRQILLNPPLIQDPPMNKRTGQFEKIAQNPLELIEMNPVDWLCYPAKVGKLIILIYFHKTFFELTFALGNLFEIATDEDLAKKPDAVYTFGVPGNTIDNLGEYSTVFFEDQANDIFIGAVPSRDEFGYFGYLKKMILTLHNAKMIKSGIMPFHGALVKIFLKSGKEATLLLIGDSGAGKSETLEALREAGKEEISDLLIIADDMGSIELDQNENPIGIGSEIGAFLRLDDLKPGYAFGQIDRAIIMSANKTNARIVIPVELYPNIIKGYQIDYVLYANNYEKIDEAHPIIEEFKNAEEAFTVFREGKVMSKGTTTTQGIVQTYFANTFAPPQYVPEHDAITKRYFDIFIKKKIFVGQMRTSLGVSGFEHQGPEQCAKALLKLIM